MQSGRTNNNLRVNTTYKQEVRSSSSIINAFNKIFVFSFDLVIISNFNVYAIVNTIKFEKRQLIDEKIAFRSDTNAYAFHFSNFAK